MLPNPCTSVHSKKKEWKERTAPRIATPRRHNPATPTKLKDPSTFTRTIQIYTQQVPGIIIIPFERGAGLSLLDCLIIKVADENCESPARRWLLVLRDMFQCLLRFIRLYHAESNKYIKKEMNSKTFLLAFNILKNK